MSRPLLTMGLLLDVVTACSPPTQHFTGLPPAPFTKGKKNVLLIGDSISMGGDPHSDPVTLLGNPGGYGNYVLRLLSGHNLVSVQHNGGPYNGSAAHAGDEQAGSSAHIVDCLDYWIGKNATHPNGLPWDVIHWNTGLHDLETAGPHGPFAVPPANYSANLAAIWATLAATGAQIVWATTTPVLFGSTPDPCTYCRNESSVLLYNSLALKALTAAAAKTSATPLRVNDLWADLTSFCGEGYKSCKLQLAGGVHCTQAGREYTGLSVAFSILSALFDFGGPHPASTIHAPQLAPPATSAAPVLRGAAPSCGAAPTPLNKTVPNVLLIGDSISMGYGFLEGAPQKCACGDSTCCRPDFRLGYGLYVEEMLRNMSAGWTLMQVQHNGGWYLDGQAGNTNNGLACLSHWLGASLSSPSGLQFDLIHINHGLHDLNGNGTEVPVHNYSSNIRAIFDRLKVMQPSAKLIFSTSTPVPVGDGGGSRTEAHVREYNAAALAALAPDIASGRVAVNDLHGDIVAMCGESYMATGKCELQVPNGVHFEYSGRSLGGLSVARALLAAQWGLGKKMGNGYS